MPETIHGTAVSLNIDDYACGLLLLGPSGSGKSDLALRLIDGGATLIADDRVKLTAFQGQLLAASVPHYEGYMEVRGVGIMRSMTYTKDIPLMLVVRLVPREEVERMPEPAFWSCLDIQVPLLSLHAFDMSTPAKIHLSLRAQRGNPVA